MYNKMTAALTQAAASTFEELGFMLPDAELDDIQRGAALEARASVSFSGPFTGRLVVRLYGRLLPSLAANMLGRMDPPSAEMQSDALGEITNVICGNALPVIAGEAAVFHLSTPQVHHAGQVERSDDAPAAVTRLGLEEGRTEVRLFIQ